MTTGEKFGKRQRPIKKILHNGHDSLVPEFLNRDLGPLSLVDIPGYKELIIGMLPLNIRGDLGFHRLLIGPVGAESKIPVNIPSHFLLHEILS